MKRSVVAALVAVVLALVGCVAVLLYVRGADARALAGQRAVKVLVVHKVIPAGTTGKQIVDGGYTETVTVPASTVPVDALSTVDGDLLTLAVTSDQQPRALLLRGAFDSPTVHSGGLSVPDGMLAVSVSMRVPAQVAGYVQPGSNVAIFDTFNEAASKGRVPAGDGLAASHDYVQATRLLLPKVLVLAIGGRGTAGAATQPQPAASGAVSESSGSGPSDSTEVLVTLAVSQDQAQRLVLATQSGALYLALLGNGADVRPGDGIDNYSLFQ
jgi:pilus assembly protein CpaB